MSNKVKLKIKDLKFEQIKQLYILLSKKDTVLDYVEKLELVPECQGVSGYGKVTLTLSKDKLNEVSDYLVENDVIY